MWRSVVGSACDSPLSVQTVRGIHTLIHCTGCNGTLADTSTGISDGAQRNAGVFLFGSSCSASVNWFGTEQRQGGGWDPEGTTLRVPPSSLPLPSAAAAVGARVVGAGQAGQGRPLRGRGGSRRPGRSHLAVRLVLAPGRRLLAVVMLRALALRIALRVLQVGLLPGVRQPALLLLQPVLLLLLQALCLVLQHGGRAQIAM